MLRTFSLLALTILAAAPLAARDRLPDGAPYCALPNTRPIFVSPMGEPFRGEAGGAYPSAVWFAGADANRDGFVDRAEFVADADRFYRSLDRNHDGRLEPEEMIAYERDTPEIALYNGRSRDVLMPPGKPSVLGNGGPSANYGGPMGAGRYGWLNTPQPVASADEDVDRIVTEHEFTDTAGRRFALLDTTGSGRLALKDLSKTPAQAAIEGPCKPRPKPKKRRADRQGLDDPDDGYGPPSRDQREDRL